MAKRKSKKVSSIEAQELLKLMREAMDKEDKRKEEIRKRALAKLTREEIEALGINKGPIVAMNDDGEILFR